ncbi:MAG: transposase [Chloroflexota bacterium]|nr:transposase [Chloroflexota bacterium]
MARKPRINLPGIPQHVIQRGHNREPCFYSEEDYSAYLEFLQLTSERTGCQIHAYVLMTNHVHLLVTPRRDYGISAMMQALGKRYVQYINENYRRSGTLWAGRYKASLVDSQAYLMTCMRYIELNPVRANMAAAPGDYRWSSYGYNGEGRENRRITPHSLYRQLGTTDAERCFAYRELFRHRMDDKLLYEIRETVNQGLVLGREDFKDKIESMLQRKVRKGKPGRPCVKEEGVYYVY